MPARSDDEAIAAAEKIAAATEAAEKTLRVTDSRGDYIGMAASTAEAQRMIEEAREGAK